MTHVTRRKRIDFLRAQKRSGERYVFVNKCDRSLFSLLLFFSLFLLIFSFVSFVRVVLHFFVVPTTLNTEGISQQNGKNRNGETAESAEEEAERTGRGRFSGVGEEERGAGKVERAEEASRRWREVR